MHAESTCRPVELAIAVPDHFRSRGSESGPDLQKYCCGPIYDWHRGSGGEFASSIPECWCRKYEWTGNRFPVLEIPAQARGLFVQRFIIQLPMADSIHDLMGVVTKLPG